MKAFDVDPSVIRLFLFCHDSYIPSSKAFCFSKTFGNKEMDLMSHLFHLRSSVNRIFTPSTSKLPKAKASAEDQSIGVFPSKDDSL